MVIGLTGQTGSGKSTVARLLGFESINADEVAHEVLLDPRVKNELCGRFGQDILDDNGEINRGELAKKAFANPNSLAMLGAITHPAIIKEILDRIELLEGRGEKIILLDAPTLFESGAHKMCSKIIFVTADGQIRKKRIMERDGLSDQAAELRLRAQKTDDFYKSADYKIINNGDKRELEKSTLSLKETLIKLTEE